MCDSAAPARFGRSAEANLVCDGVRIRDACGSQDRCAAQWWGSLECNMISANELTKKENWDRKSYP